jgi:hypothetical protein
LVHFVVLWYILWYFGTFCGTLVHFVVVWYIFTRFGILHRCKNLAALFRNCAIKFPSWKRLSAARGKFNFLRGSLDGANPTTFEFRLERFYILF